MEKYISLLTFEPVFYSVLALIVLYLIFVQVMKYKERKEKRGYLHWYEWVAVAALGIVGYPLDVIINATLGSIVFLEFPQEPTLSDRLDCYYEEEKTETFIDRWRLWVARKVAPILNRHDKGHIG